MIRPAYVHPQEAISALLDGELSPPDQAIVEAHLERCAACRSLRRDLERIKAVTGEETVPPVPADLAARLRDRIANAEGRAPALLAAPKAWLRWQVSTSRFKLSAAAALAATVLLSALALKEAARLQPPRVGGSETHAHQEQRFVPTASSGNRKEGEFAAGGLDQPEQGRKAAGTRREDNLELGGTAREDTEKVGGIVRESEGRGVEGRPGGNEQKAEIERARGHLVSGGAVEGAAAVPHDSRSFERNRQVAADVQTVPSFRTTHSDVAEEADLQDKSLSAGGTSSERQAAASAPSPSAVAPPSAAAAGGALSRPGDRLDLPEKVVAAGPPCPRVFVLSPQPIPWPVSDPGLAARQLVSWASDRGGRAAPLDPRQGLWRLEAPRDRWEELRLLLGRNGVASLRAAPPETDCVRQDLRIVPAPPDPTP